MPNRTLLQNNILKLQEETNLPRRELHHLFTFHKAMLRDTSNLHLGGHPIKEKVQLHRQKVVQSLSVLLNLPIESVEAGLTTIVRYYEREMLQLDFGSFPTFARVVRELRRTA
mgnify:CR=1 FL=1